MANERTHMNTQAGSRLRQATAVRGKTEIGSQPIQRDPSVTSMDSILLASLSGNGFTLLQTGEPRRQLEADRHPSGQSYEPVQSGKSDRGSGAGCIRPWRNSPTKCASPTGNNWLR